MAVDKIFDELGKMSVLELVELKNKIEEEWGVTAAAPVAVAATGGAAGDGAAAEEKTSFDDLDHLDLLAACPGEDDVEGGLLLSRRRSRGGGEDLLRRRPHRGRRPEDPGDQGRPCGDGPRPQGGEGPRGL